MKISIFNTSDNKGGAARAAFRLFKSLENHGIDINFYTRQKYLTRENIIKLGSRHNTKIENILQKNLILNNRTDISNTFFSISYSGITFDDMPKDCDIINLHWVEKFLDNHSLKEFTKLNKPIVWTLHDMKPFTGGCHYNAGCREFENECLDCQQLKCNPHNLTNMILKEKIKILKNANLTIVTPSKWLAEEAKKSTLFKNKKIEVIPNSIEIDTYKPINKNEAKQRLEIDSNKIVLQFGAYSTKEKRKGFYYLVKAINIALENERFKKLCDDNKVLILCMGHPSDELKNLPIEFKELGFVSEDEKIALAYNATDLFILPTLEDNLPNTMLESFACKTPIIAFDTGGVRDMVKNEENGIVVPKYDAKGLASGILELIFNKTKREIFGENGRKLIESNFKLEDQATAYIKLFEELLHKDEKEIYLEILETEENIYDKIVGYSLKKELEQNPHLMDDPVNKKSKIIYKDNDSLIKLKKCLNEVCRYSAFKKPIKKMKAYKRLIRTFHEIR